MVRARARNGKKIPRNVFGKLSFKKNASNKDVTSVQIAINNTQKLIL